MTDEKTLRHETFFHGYDQTKLFLQTWEHPDAIGTILITHGQAEHSECYQRLVSGLQNESILQEKIHWNFMAWDLRGHGRSEGQRGFAKDFNEYVFDYDFFIKACLFSGQHSPLLNKALLEKPVFLYGHSMGGLIQTCSLSDPGQNLAQVIKPNSNKIHGQILSSPLFGVAATVPPWKDKGAEWIQKIFPHLTLSNELNNDMLSRDVDVLREYEKDTYRHGKISAGVYLGFKREFLDIESKAQKIHLPTLMTISDSDPVVSSPTALEFFDHLSSADKTLKIFDGGKHELHNDICRNDVYKTIHNYLKNHLS